MHYPVSMWLDRKGLHFRILLGFLENTGTGSSIVLTQHIAVPTLSREFIGPLCPQGITIRTTDIARSYAQTSMRDLPVKIT